MIIISYTKNEREVTFYEKAYSNDNDGRWISDES